MRGHALTFLGVTVDAPPTWRDITDELHGEDPPVTLADAGDDVGALQFSVARYGSGPVPNPSPAELLDMAEELGTGHGLSHPHERVTEGGALRLGAVSYRDADEFFRIWYVSDGRNIAKVTYVCPWDLRTKQREECETIVRSLRFL